MVLSVVAIFLASQGQTFSRVDAGGPKLRMLMTGSGNSTVVFESGAGGPLETWLRVQPAVSKFAKTISYDRAGNGLSKKGPVPRDGRRIATELHTALHNATRVAALHSGGTFAGRSLHPDFRRLVTRMKLQVWCWWIRRRKT